MRYVYRTFGWLLGVCLFLALGCGMEPQPEGIQHQAGPSNQQEYGVLQQAINLCNHTLTAGQSIRRTISITLPNVPPKADVMFASDLTSSMVEEVSKAKTNSTSIMNQITALIPDTAFGAMSFKDYAKSYKYCNYQTSTGGAVLYGSGQDFAYKLDQSITTNKTSVSTAINGWNISSDPNTDYPASYTRALWEMYNDTNVKWRTGSKRFILLFGDALPHDCSLNVPPYTLTTGPDPGRDQIAGTTDDLQWTTTITGLKNNNISLITLYSGPAKLKLGGPPLNVFDFWDIASQNTGGDAFQLDTQGNLPNKTNIADFIKTKVQALSATISNLTIGLCKDQSTTYNAWLSNPDSQTNVTSGTGPHSFGITVMPPTGTTPGAYTFDVCIYGDGVEYARQSCAITVSGCTLPGVGDPCSVGTGACRRTGTKQCNAAGTALECSVTAGKPTAETCDSIDNDCDGQIDENWPTKGQVCTVGIGACQRNGSNVCNAARTGITCSVSPGTPTSEQCDAIDNDCDGQVDEGFNKGQACTVGTGQCVRSGTYVCRSNGSGTQCSATAGTPTAEKCDNLDNDCDGQIDEGFNKGQACNVGTGECRRTGTYACKVDGSGTQCSATAGTPTVETCDGKDNDCDGQIDENWPTKGNACSVGVTECKRTGTNICNATGTGIQCSATAGTPTAETCDGKDNDCDGQIDEDFPTKNKACSVGVGECLRTGTNQCKSNGSGVQCSVSVGTPSAETCDGKDNDCDGLTDENWPTKGNACTSGKGLCRRAGTLICASNGAGLACSATPGTPSTETCNNGQDEDCDGLTDEGCVQPACSAGQTRSCYGGPAGTAGKGICKAGTQACVSGQWGPCVGEVLPATEKCDNIDNDCDGAKDETFANLGQACSAGTGECKTTGTYICATTTSSTICSAKAGTPTAERCDGKDNDCDGAIDENWPTLNQPCQGGTGACISTGKYICAVSGAGVECSSKGTAGTKELCDNIDNDCDGQVDEDFTTLGAACTVGVGECKATGKNRCKADKTGVECDSKPQLPSTEICDNKDNDCDGQIDESVTQACSSACGAGIQICQAGKFGACNAPKPTTELCDNKDNDCDGQIDNGLVRACTSKCGKGTETCAKGTWQSCSAPAPSKEVCDGKDNDCDGTVDEDIAPKTCQGACGSGTANCESGVFVGCTGDQPTPEVCDGVDNDCNGKIDDIEPRTCRSECGEGKESCVDGIWKNCNAPKPEKEVCDALDNNCDGFIDNEAPCGAGQGCYKGTCTATCKEDKECGDGNQCVEGFCTGDPCKGVECPENKRCVSGHCVDACALLTCPQGAVCRSGKCVEDSCYGLGCPGGQICKEGTCAPDPCLAAQCKADQACREGTCVDSCAWVRCSLGQRCEDGKCVDDPCQTKSCNNGQICLNDKCVDDPCASVTCGAGRVCDPGAGKCIDDPCLALQCPQGQVCKEGQCMATGPRESIPTDETTDEEKKDENTINKNNGDAGPSGNDGGTKAPGGCGCQTQAGSTPSLPLSLLLLFALFAFVRRRAPNARLAKERNR